ncbi:hypothetical protein WDU94_014081 [Cyamophila willieti]
MSFLPVLSSCSSNSNSTDESSFIARNKFNKEEEKVKQENIDKENEEDNTNCDIFPIYLFEDIGNDSNESEFRAASVGDLNEKTIRTGLSVLKHNTNAGGWILTKLVLSDIHLHDVSTVCRYKNIRWLDMSRNRIQDMEFLQHIIDVVYLSLAHNSIAKLGVVSQGLYCLKVINLSFNCIQFIPCNFSTQFLLLTHLNLSHNAITKINGLDFSHLKFLKVLNLSFNKIKKLENLAKLSFSELYVNNNVINEFVSGEEGFVSNKQLTVIDISHNYLTSLELFSSAHSLVKIIASSNRIESPAELSYLRNLYYLRDLNLEKNPLTSWHHYRRYVFSTVTHLIKLDKQYITESEFNEIHKNIDFMDNVEMGLQQNQCKFVMPLTKYRKETAMYGDREKVLIILVGTLGSHILESICSQVSHLIPNIHLVKKITTSSIRSKINIHVSHERFQELVQNEEFLAIDEQYGVKFGFSRKQIYTSLKECEICLTDMDLKSALKVQSLGYNPYLILVHVEDMDKFCNILLKNFDFAIRKSISAGIIKESPKKLVIRSEVNIDNSHEDEDFMENKSDSNASVTVNETDIAKLGNIENSNKQNHHEGKYDKHSDGRHLNNNKAESDKTKINTNEAAINQDVLNKMKAVFVKDMIRKAEFYHKNQELFGWSVILDDVADGVDRVADVVRHIVHDHHRRKRCRKP